uniref:Uncharacterized protein n=1 Tax=Cercocebus atys TaxID=9531 RepID=A0A2K5KZV7_CERAT
MLRDSGSAEVGGAPAGPRGAILAGGDVGQRAGHARPGPRQVPEHPPGVPARWTEATSPCAPAAVRTVPGGSGQGSAGRRSPRGPHAGSLPPVEGAGRGTRVRA